MENKILVDSDGNYLGEFSANNPSIPEGAIEVDKRPANGRLIYNFQTNSWQEKAKTANEKKQELKEQLISSRKNYLNQTDWYCLREIDLPKSYPLAIKNKRIQAWQEIENIESINTLAALNEFKKDIE